MTVVFLLRGDVNAAPELYSWLPGLVHVAQTRLAAGSPAPTGTIVLAVLSDPGFEAQLAPLVHPVAPKTAVMPHLACVAVRIPLVAPSSFPTDPSTDSPSTHLQRLLHSYPQPSAPYFESLLPRADLDLATHWATCAFRPATTRIIATSMPLGTGAKPKRPVPRKERRSKRREARAASVPAKAAAAARKKTAKVVVAAVDGPAATAAVGDATAEAGPAPAVATARDGAVTKPSPGKKRAQPPSPRQPPPPGQRQSKKPRTA
ncbi:hypothetical protein AMAG_02224 [Allomyces macrogynus ATCC 38327]|uniref:Uncharacterized protein n=1 Tax=Allomyces macrogynus (strain ATCC 38327) TaxID=578462 RepID=A0A0L0S1Y0_ALLM3|nr:hypothetical protein AMAG_02224 [Allomyces macrogynus ATCC 38327]|eukprot:KNE56415.1 hypothetical protein AMAG_02224 [Allomyces macrogynus ATCC 38327]